MAVYDSTLGALEDLTDLLSECDSVAQMVSELVSNRAPGEQPAWVFYFVQQQARIEAAAEKLEIVLRTQALPVLKDFSAVNRRG